MRLGLRLTGYFAVLIGSLTVLVTVWPPLIGYLPVGGTDAMAVQDITDMKEILQNRPAVPADAGRIAASGDDQIQRVLRIAAFVFAHLSGSILLMLPVTWTYKGIKYADGFNKHFVRSLIILPICATTTVLLIQDSLALAFGLAALVAAVRFRVALDEAMDGIFIFAAVCIGLAAGIGYLGVATLMSMFFCYTNLVLWHLDYGNNPVDQARRARKRDKNMGQAGNP